MIFSPRYLSILGIITEKYQISTEIRHLKLKNSNEFALQLEFSIIHEYIYIYFYRAIRGYNVNMKLSGSSSTGQVTRRVVKRNVDAGNENAVIFCQFSHERQ